MTFPAPTPGDPKTLGYGIQRTMRLLATSTPKRRNRVRILFYGQSITVQDWTKRVADDLRRRFPHADLEIENRAIGGFASQLLKLPAEHDLYPFYPDLLIFHVYGSHTDYEGIIRSVRSRTAAEVLMQKDHVTAWPDPNASQTQNTGMWWSRMMNDVYLPSFAEKYGCGLVDVPTGWLGYLKANNLQPSALLSDEVHLNDHGNYLMAELIKQYLVVRPELEKQEPRLSWDVPIRPSMWKKGKLALDFDGNRVDLLPARSGGRLSVRIDGKKPSEFPSMYAITRPTPNPWSPLALVRVDHASPLRIEDWTLEITKVDETAQKWSYRVVGSLTGPDGEGSNDQTFTSNSGRVKIEPGSFYKAGKFEPGYQIKWRVVPTHLDQYSPTLPQSPASDAATTIAQGLPNGRHRLELTATDGQPAIKAVRIYRPPVK